MVTPTGAAIIAAVAQPGAVPQLQLAAVGYGAGERTLPDRPNLLRVLVGNTSETPREEQLLVLETNIDDLNPELYEHVMERLFAAGARDVFLAPIQMKKNRPGVLLWVLGESADRDKLSTIRSYPVTRVALRRESKEVVTPYGSVRVKLAHGPNGHVNVAPEYEDCKRLAREKGAPLKLIYEAAVRSARET
jgi:uncharacterized protein (DUF111 family)